MPATELPHPSNDGQKAIASDALQLTVEWVAGLDGGRLRRGEMGWIHLQLVNLGQESVELMTIVGFGKGRDGPTLRPAYKREGYYNGVGLAKLTYEFFNEAGHRVHQGHLDPPDDPIVLPRHHYHSVCRKLTAPAKPGVYRLRITWDSAAACEAAGTVNWVHPIQPEQTAIRVAVAERVVIEMPLPSANGPGDAPSITGIVSIPDPFSTAENTVARVMRQQGIRAKSKKTFVPRTTDSKHGRWQRIF